MAELPKEIFGEFGFFVVKTLKRGGAMRTTKFGIGIFICTIFLAFTMLLSISIADAATEEQITVSIEKGLAWLASVQDPVSGAWHYCIVADTKGCYDDCYDIGTTALVLLKFVERAKELEKNPFDPVEYLYAPNVIAGFDYIFGLAESYEDTVNFASCVNNNYSISTSMMAVASCPDLGRTITVGALTGQTFGEALQGMMNWLVYAQQKNILYACDEGGWDYWGDILDPPDQLAWADQSNTGYATLGIGFAANAGISIPPSVLPLLNIFIGNAQIADSSSPYFGGSLYNTCETEETSWWVNILKTGHLLYEMALVGDSISTARVQNAVGYIQDHWSETGEHDDVGGVSVGWMDSYQSMFTMMKGLESFNISLIDTNDDGNADDDWFDQVSDVLVANQGTCNPYDSECFLSIADYLREGEQSEVLRTAWALLTLESIVVLPPRCGNGETDANEECDDGNLIDGDGCDSNCTVTACGNGIITENEECDDGNTADGDGCNSLCMTEYCGDRIVQIELGEQCDDGNTEDGDGCNSLCQAEYCGDGIIQALLGEQCDDGNIISGDGCDANCMIENNPPVCSAYATPDCLWSPNHKMVSVSILGANDPDGDPLTITITSITSDEPTATDEGSGGKKHAPDASGIGTNTAMVSNERSGNGDGRVYVINFTALDGKGGECTGSVSVKVPHDQRLKHSGLCPAIDSGQNYDATQIN